MEPDMDYRWQRYKYAVNTRELMTTCQQSACHELIIWRLVGLHTFDVYSDFSLLIKTNQLSFCSPIHPGSDVACWLKTFFFLLLIIFYTLYIHIFIFWSIFTECYRNEINKLNKQINKKKSPWRHCDACVLLIMMIFVSSCFAELAWHAADVALVMFVNIFHGRHFVRHVMVREAQV